MYCPRCASPLAEQTERCRECGLDARPFAELLREGARAGQGAAGLHALAAQLQRWNRQRHSLGLLLILCSLLVACFIPISAGLLSGSIALGSLILVLAGFAGVLLLLGTMLILAAEGAILTSHQPPSDPPAAGATPLLAHDLPADFGSPEQAGSRAARR